MLNSKDRAVVVIPNWNGTDMISACIESLQKQTLQVEIIIVDNGSTDSSCQMIKSNFPKVTLLEFPDNAGFAGGVNRGIRYAQEQGTEFVLLLNNDAIADTRWTEKLIAKAMTDEKLGIIASKMLRENGKTLDSTGELYSIWGMPFPRGRNHKDSQQYDSQTEIFGASGGASLYRASLFDDIGLFDEDFFAYYEDVDLSFRAHMAGWKIVYQPEAKVFHKTSSTSSRLHDFARYQSAKNFLLLYARNMPTKLYLKYLPLFSLQLLRMFFGALVNRKVNPFFRGTISAVKLHPQTRAVRKRNLNKQTVKTSYIDSLLTKSYPPKIPKL